MRFDVSEPATIYYTTDGTTPTIESPRYKETEFREPGETLWVEQTTTFKWFSVDAAGNLEPMRSATVQIGETGAAGRHRAGDALARRLGPNATFGAFTPGVAKDYTATTSANVISTAGDAALTVSDPGRLTNGTFSLPEPLVVELSKAAWTAPVSNDPVTITFKQHIGANDALRTGSLLQDADLHAVDDDAVSDGRALTRSHGRVSAFTKSSSWRVVQHS